MKAIIANAMKKVKKKILDSEENFSGEHKKDEILVMNPSFVMYSFYAKINDNKVNSLELDENFQINKEDFLQKIHNENLKVLFLCSPNNPTGNEVVDLEFFIENFPDQVINRMQFGIGTPAFQNRQEIRDFLLQLS